LRARAQGNFEEQNKGSGSSTIIINYCIVINAYYNYYISTTGLLLARDKEENLEVTGAATTSSLKLRL
jgi:hypothetical protein